MDQGVEQIYNLLADENYPVTLADLKNPTSEYMVKIVLTFLSGFSIDGSTIQRPTFGQLESLSYAEAHQEVISLINLHQVMRLISNRIFVKDFCLTDMTSPGAKKSRRLIWTLLNFVLYANDKMKDLVETMDEIVNTLNTQSDLIQKTNECMEERKTVVLDNSKKTALKEKLLKQIEEAKKRIKQNDKEMVFLEERVKTAHLAKQKAQQKNGTIKQQAVKINEEIIELEEMVVKSPEKYKKEKDNYGGDFEKAQEKLEGLTDRLSAKQDLKNQFDKVEEFVIQKHEALEEAGNVLEKSKTLAETKAEISKELFETESVLQKLRDAIAKLNESSQCDANKVDKAQAQVDQEILPHRKTHMKLLSETQDVKKKLAAIEVRYQESRYEKDNLGKKITSLNEEIAEFLIECHNLYIGDLRKQAEIEKSWKGRYNTE